MSSIPENQVEEWLKKLERESWQLELLVSAFTIFLLIGANSAYTDFLRELKYQYDSSGLVFTIVALFLILTKNSILALTVSLIIHLMLRGFWIGAIGLRSVQSTVDFSKLNYNDFFTEKLKKTVISLDKLVVKLDEICSVIFAFSFLIISILLAFAMYLVFLGIFGFGINSLVSVLPSALTGFFTVLSVVIFLFLLVMGLIYMIDYFTLGFFKKIKWFARFYYPFYRFFNIITMSGLSRSIYYYLISKFSKKRIRILYLAIAFTFLVVVLFNFDQYQFNPELDNKLTITANTYEDQRKDDFIEKVSIPSHFIREKYFPLFLRYNAIDNELIRSHCPDFEPIKEDGINWNLGVKTNNGGLTIGKRDYSKEDAEAMLTCQASIYQVLINDSIHQNLNFRFYTHPAKNQKGLLATIPTDKFILGENTLEVKKVLLDSVGNTSYSDYAFVPFWYDPN